MGQFVERETIDGVVRRSRAQTAYCCQGSRVAGVASHASVMHGRPIRIDCRVHLALSLTFVFAWYLVHGLICSRSSRYLPCLLSVVGDARVVQGSLVCRPHAMATQCTNRLASSVDPKRGAWEGTGCLDDIWQVAWASPS